VLLRRYFWDRPAPPVQRAPSMTEEEKNKPATEKAPVTAQLPL